MGFLVLQQLQEGFLLQLEYVLLGDPLRDGDAAAGEDAGDLAGDDAIVLRGVAAPLQGLDLDLQGQAHGLPGGVDPLVMDRWGVAVREVENLALGGVYEVVGVHDDPIVVVEEAHLLRLQGAGRDLRERYVLEGLLHVRQGGGAGVHRRGDEAPYKLLGAAARRDQADADLDEAHVGLARSTDPVGVQRDLRPAP